MKETKFQQLLTSKLSKYLTGFDSADTILTVLLTSFFWNKYFCPC